MKTKKTPEELKKAIERKEYLTRTMQELEDNVKQLQKDVAQLKAERIQRLKNKTK